MSCKHCPGNYVEDEVHFMTECPKYDIQRLELFTKIRSKCELFYNMNNTNKFIYMLSAGQEVAALVAEFIYCNLP